jgi:hypothetical protein
MCVAVAGVDDASTLAPQLAPISAGALEIHPMLAPANAHCRADEIPILLWDGDSFTLLVP